MGEKIFSFRWDIDHLYGLEKGVPNILSTCKDYNIKCTFYINLGKAFNLKEWLFNSPKKSYHKLNSATSINIVKKIGYFRLFQLLLHNPNVGLSRLDLLKRISDEGHELGLHGAMNHMLWSRRIKNFKIDEIERMLMEAISLFRDKLGIDILGFAAPGFNWSIESLTSLNRCGFAYVGDLKGDMPFYPEVDDGRLDLLCIPVTVIGPNTVPIIEYYSALGKNPTEIADLVLKEIGKRHFAIMYGHPVFEGFKTDILKRIFTFVLENEFQVLTHEEIYKLYRANSPYVNILPHVPNTGGQSHKSTM